ncbi:MAG: hypothetical protein QGG25_00385 [Phycisphaerae bacterium]|jgi:hypothetical protein|nr:hypothetical protein [Phycisphaerae bacterium]
MMKKYKRWVIAFLATVAVLFVAMGLLVYVMDPLQYFRPVKFYKPSYSFQTRLMIPGIIRNCDYEALILGSSTAQNSRPTQVEKLFGSECVKLTPPGASAREVSIYFQTAAKRREIKLVIQGVDFFSYAGAPDRLRTGHPDHLYRMTPSNFYKYFYDAYTLKKIITKTDWSSVFDSEEYSFDHDRFASYAHRKKPSRAKAIRSYFNSNYSASYCGDAYDAESKVSFRENVVKIIAANPKTKFNLYFSPGSILDWLVREKHGDIDKLLAFRLFVAGECQRLDNVELFDFQADAKITHNFDLYYDVTHFDQTISEHIVSSIHSGLYKTDPDKCKQANAELRAQIEAFKRDVLPGLKPE